MDFWQQTNWFAVQAKPHCENLAASSVARLDAEVFLPKVKHEQLVCAALRFVSKPLFTGYFFARFCPLVSLDAVRYARGVLRVVGSASFPTPLASAVVSTIQNRVQADGFIRLEAQSLRPGDPVAIEAGPFQGLMGKVEHELDDEKRVMILLETMWNARVLIEKRWLAVVLKAA